MTPLPDADLHEAAAPDPVPLLLLSPESQWEQAGKAAEDLAAGE